MGARLESGEVAEVFESEGVARAYRVLGKVPWLAMSLLRH